MGLSLRIEYLPQSPNLRGPWRIQQSANVSWPTHRPFFSTPLLLVSLTEHLKASKMSPQIVAVKRRHGFQQASIRIGVLQCLLPSKHLRNRRSREPYKYVPCALQFALQFIHLTTQSRAGLCPRHSIGYPLWSSTKIRCTDFYRIHHGPASQTVPVRDMISTRCTPIHASRSKIRVLG